MAGIDHGMVEFAAEVLGVGRVYSYPRRQPHFHDESIFAVRPIRELAEVVVPFMDVHLPPSKKRQQYLAWREQLLAHWEHDARRRRECTVEGCSKLQRGKGLCRHHYYREFGK